MAEPTKLDQIRNLREARSRAAERANAASEADSKSLDLKKPEDDK